MALVSDTIFSLLVLATGLFGAGTLGFAVLWLRARERAIRAEQRASPLPGAGDARLERIERALDAVATDVDRVEEGQRFLGQLLGGRPARGRDADVPVGGATPAA